MAGYTKMAYPEMVYWSPIQVLTGPNLE